MEQLGNAEIKSLDLPITWKPVQHQFYLGQVYQTLMLNATRPNLELKNDTRLSLTNEEFNDLIHEMEKIFNKLVIKPQENLCKILNQGIEPRPVPRFAYFFPVLSGVLSIIKKGAVEISKGVYASLAFFGFTSLVNPPTETNKEAIMNDVKKLTSELESRFEARLYSIKKIQTYLTTYITNYVEFNHIITHYQLTKKVDEKFLQSYNIELNMNYSLTLEVYQCTHILSPTYSTLKLDLSIIAKR